jgi:crotonobetainyl-CoA:carnitine CoA-transferase CaiB-like acyl-CoA transferase
MTHEAAVSSLEGLRVVDVTTNVAGPFATQILGDLGADVIKVERPGSGDDTRGWGPPFWSDGVGVSFSSLNRNKRSIALDLTDEGDAALLTSILAEADVLVENMRPGAFARLGFGRDRLAEANPRLIQCHITGFGTRGRLAGRPAYDPLMQAFSGLMSLNGHPDGEPARIPVSVLDKGSGMWAVIGILNALRLRDRTGVGSEVNTSLIETALTWEASQIAGYLADGRVPAPMGSATPGISPYQALRTQDRPLVVAAGNQRLWVRLCEALGRTDLMGDIRFRTNADRVSHREDLVLELESVLLTRSAKEWSERLGMVGVPCSVVRTVDLVADDPLLEDLDVLARDTTADEGASQVWVNLPLETNGHRFPVRRRPPELDQDGSDIRKEFS